MATVTECTARNGKAAESAPTADPRKLREYFTALCEPAEDTRGRLCLYRKTPYQLCFVDPDDIDRMVSASTVLGQKHDLYCHINLVDPAAEQAIIQRHGRPREAEICAVLALAADIDAHKPRSKANYPPQSVILEVLDRMPLPVSLVPISGKRDGGVHAYWLLHEPFVIDSPEARAYIKRLSLSWQRLLKAKIEAAGYKLDSTFDLCRVLRPCGALNHKYGTVVDALEWRPERRYSPADFEEYAFEIVTADEAVGDGPDFADRKLTGGDAASLSEWVKRLETHEKTGKQRHPMDFAFCKEAIRHEWPKENVWSAVRKVSKFSTDGRAYFDRTWKNAAAAVGHDEAEGVRYDRSDKPTIIIGADEERVTDEAIAALKNRDGLYQRGGRLVQIVRNSKSPPGIIRPANAPRIVAIKQPRLREMLASAACWMRPADEDFDVCHPPEWAVKATEARGEWESVPWIEGVVESPVIRVDGSVLQTPGYDEATGLFYETKVSFPTIPAKPTKDDAIRCVAELLEVVEDFPFRLPVHRAAWLSGLLTPLARHAFAGPAPLHLTDANTPGCGKTLLNDLVSRIINGREMPKAANPHDDDEFRKRITAVAVCGDPMFLIDNVSGSFGCPSLDAALTATTWSDRELGRSELLSGLSLNVTWYATGNNLVLVGDTGRRTLQIRLESKEEKPEERTGFRHENLVEWVLQNRPRLVTAAVTILAAYCAAGRPDQRLKAWGSYEGWTGLVRQAIVWAGQPDPGDTRQELVRQSDRDVNALRVLVTSLEAVDPDGMGLTASEIIGILELDAKEDSPKLSNLRNAIMELVSAKGGMLPSARSLGMKLHHLRGRVIAGRFIEKRDTDRGAEWLVRRCESAGTTDTTDTI